MLFIIHNYHSLACTLPLIYLTDHARKELRFKDEATCLSTFKTYIKYRKRCLLTQTIYKEVEVSDLGVDDTKVWKVRSCLPRLRRDQIAKGLYLSNLPGVSKHAGNITHVHVCTCVCA